MAFLIPLRGVSILDGDGQPFCDREADQAMFDALRENLRPGIPVVEVDANINDPAFAEKAVEMMLELILTKAKPQRNTKQLTLMNANHAKCTISAISEISVKLSCFVSSRLCVRLHLDLCQ